MRYWLFCAWRMSHDNETVYDVTRCKRCHRAWRYGLRVR